MGAKLVWRYLLCIKCISADFNLPWTANVPRGKGKTRAPVETPRRHAVILLKCTSSWLFLLSFHSQLLEAPSNSHSVFLCTVNSEGPFKSRLTLRFGIQLQLFWILKSSLTLKTLRMQMFQKKNWPCTANVSFSKLNDLFTLLIQIRLFFKGLKVICRWFLNNALLNILFWWDFCTRSQSCCFFLLKGKRTIFGKELPALKLIQSGTITMMFFTCLFLEWAHKNYLFRSSEIQCYVFRNLTYITVSYMSM